MIDDEIFVTGLSRGCAGCPAPHRILAAAKQLAALNINPDDFPEEVEDMAQMACGPCGDAVLCERVDGHFMIDISKK